MRRGSQLFRLCWHMLQTQLKITKVPTAAAHMGHFCSALAKDLTGEVDQCNSADRFLSSLRHLPL